MMARTTTGLRVFLLAIGLAVLAGCSFSTPFKDGASTASTPGDVAGDTVLVILTEATIQAGPDKRFAFIDRTLGVEKSLEGQPGLVGHSLSFEPFGRRAWTMTVWADEESANAFILGPTHQAAVGETFKLVDDARFARLTLPREEVPLDWTRAREILATEGRGYFE